MYNERVEINRINVQYTPAIYPTGDTPTQTPPLRVWGATSVFLLITLEIQSRQKKARLKISGNISGKNCQYIINPI